MTGRETTRSTLSRAFPEMAGATDLAGVDVGHGGGESTAVDDEDDGGPDTEASDEDAGDGAGRADGPRDDEK